MAENWEFYLCRIRGKPASVYVDLSAHTPAAVARHPYMGYVSIRMLAPRNDGLSDETEIRRLVELEDGLAASLTAGGSAIYVGRNTCNGYRDLFFYTSSDDEWQQQVGAVMTTFRDYLYDASVRHEPDWLTYRRFLYPGERDLHRIRNRRMCEILQKHGDTLSADREIEHWISLPDANARAAFIEAAADLGYRVQAFYEHHKEGEAYGVRLLRTDVPAYSLIDGATLPLFDLARKFEGSYGRWETGVIAENGAAQ